MRWPVALLVGIPLMASASGCRNNCELVESQLRARESDVQTLREELDRSQLYNHALQQQLHALQAGHPVAAYPVKSLALGRQTGGRASDNCPGDDALYVVLEPRDPEGQAIKAPGSALIRVLEVTPEGLKRPLSAWEVPPDQLRRAWRNGLFSTGYGLTLPWKAWPNTPTLRVVAQFRVADGRLFEADKEITVHLLPANKRPPLPPAPVVTPAPFITPAPTPKAPPAAPRPSTDQLLPPPRPLDKSNPPPPDPPPSGPDLGQAMHRPAPKKPAPFVWRAVPDDAPPPTAKILRPVPDKGPK